MTILREQNISKIGGATPTVGAFGQLVTAYEVRDIAVKWEYQVYDTNFDMLAVESTGDGAQSFDSGLLVASSATTGTVKLKSKKATRYRAGNGGFSWFTAILNSGSGQCYAGLESDAGDRIIIRENNGTVEFGYAREGVDQTFVASTSFNGNADVGSITWTNLNIFQVRYGYLGTADIEIFIKQDGETKLLHRIELAGQLTNTHIRFPQFRQAIYAENGATVKSGSWAAGTFSNVLESRGEDPSARPFFNSTTRVVVPSGTPAPVVAYRSKSTFNTFTHNITAKLILGNISSSSEGQYKFTFLFNPTSITGGTFSDINTLSSVIEVNEGVTGYTGGEERFSTVLSVPTSGTGTASLSADFEKLGVFLDRGEDVVITIEEIVSGGGNNTQTLDFAWQELV